MVRTPNERIERQAQDWFIRLESGVLAPDEQEHFADWLDANPAHRAAYRQLDAFSRALVGVEELAALGAPPAKPRGNTQGGHQGWAHWLERLADTFSIRRTAVAFTAALLLIAGASLIVLYQTMPAHSPGTLYATRTAETRDIQLADGTTVSLGARTRVEVHYSDRERTVRFTDGEAYFNVAPNAERPFIVQTGDTRVRVVGTAFNLRATHGRLDVAVAQGKVSVSQPQESPIPFWGRIRPREVSLTAGEQLVAKGEGFSDIEPIKVEEVGSWRRGKLIYHDTPLGEVLSDVRRYSKKDIVLTDPALAELRLSAVLGTDQIDRMVLAMSLLLPVEVDQSVPGTIAIQPAAGATTAAP